MLAQIMARFTQFDIRKSSRGGYFVFNRGPDPAGGPAIAANPREASRLLRFWVKVPNTNSEIGTTRLTRARARGRQFLRSSQLAAHLATGLRPDLDHGSEVESIQ
jgi:hypothetical protein